jgi:CheY-like chemotaxis protein
MPLFWVMSREDILIVDDNPDARETLAIVLELAGYTVRQAENGKVALQMAVQGRPALILLDLMMPVMSGWELLDALRGDPSLRAVPVVIVSAATSAPSGVPVLRKPVSVDQLLDTVCNSMGPSPA